MAKRSGLEMIGGAKREEAQPSQEATQAKPMQRTRPESSMAGEGDGWAPPAAAAMGESLVHGIPTANLRRGGGQKDQRQREPVVSFRGIPPDLKARVEKLADEQFVPVGMLARYLFEHGIRAYGWKKLVPAPALKPGGWSLYQGSEAGPGRRAARGTSRGAGKKRKGLQAKSGQAPVAYRGVPPETRQSMLNIAEELGVPVGEVARYFLEYGLDEHAAGRLQFNRYPVSSAAHTLYPEKTEAKSPDLSGIPSTWGELINPPKSRDARETGENHTNLGIDDLM